MTDKDKAPEDGPGNTSLNESVESVDMIGYGETQPASEEDVNKAGEQAEALEDPKFSPSEKRQEFEGQ